MVKVGGKVVLTAGDLRQELEVEKESSLDGDLVHKMFAKKMIQELEDSEIGPREEELIKDLSIKYGILSRFTSFICVDQETATEVGEMVVRQVDSMALYGSVNGFLSTAGPVACLRASAPSSGVPMHVARCAASAPSSRVARKQHGSTAAKGSPPENVSRFKGALPE